MDGSSYMPVGATPYVPEGATPVSQPTITDRANTALDTLGIGKIPLVGGLAKGLVDPETQYLDTVLQKRQQLGQTPTAQQPQVAKQMLSELPGEAFPAALNLSMAADLPSVAGAAKTLLTGGAKVAQKGLGMAGNVLAHPTQNTIIKAMGDATANASKAGMTTTWEEIANELRNAASTGKNKYVAGLQDEIKKIIANRQPASVLENVTPNRMELRSPKLDPTELHNLRQGIDETLRGTWGNPNIRNTGIKANQILRDVVSKKLHSLAPEMKNLDSLYRFYSNPLIKGGKLPIVGNLKYPTAVAGLPSAGINALLGGILGESLVKKLGL